MWGFLHIAGLLFLFLLLRAQLPRPIWVLVLACDFLPPLEWGEARRLRAPLLALQKFSYAEDPPDDTHPYYAAENALHWTELVVHDS